jgi:hypothetical protein
MSIVRPSEDSSIDWTGVQRDASPIGPLDDRSFIARLLLPGERARSLTILRRAFMKQQSPGEQLPRHPESAPRSSR